MSSTAPMLQQPIRTGLAPDGWIEVLRGGDRVRIRPIHAGVTHGTDAAYVAVVDDPLQDRVIGVARFSAAPHGSDCEFSLAVSDAWQGKGLGTHLMFHLVEAARRRGLARMHASDASDNHRMRSFAGHLHFRDVQDPDDAGQTLYSLDLKT